MIFVYVTCDAWMIAATSFFMMIRKFEYGDISFAVVGLAYQTLRKATTILEPVLEAKLPQPSGVGLKYFKE